MILGIDPGLANTGWAVLSDEKTLVECGCLKTKITDNSAFRLNQIYDELEKLIKKYKVDAMAIETLFFAKNAKSAIKVAEAIGVIKVCGQRNGIEVEGYSTSGKNGFSRIWASGKRTGRNYGEKFFRIR